MIESLSHHPIFIVGFPRSGTTLLQAMLSTQPGIVSFPETQYFRIADRLGVTDADALFDSLILTKFLAELKRTADLEFPDSTTAGLRALASAGRLRSRELFECLVRTLVGKTIGDRDPAAVRWLEKTPGHIIDMNVIRAWYPSVQFIHIIRHPLCAIYSARIKLIRRDGSFRPWIDLARRWQGAINAADRFRAQYSENLLEIHYETLVESPERVLGQLAEFLRVPLDVELALNYRAVSKELITPREWWKQDVMSAPLANTNNPRLMPFAAALRVQQIIGDTMQRLGYPLEYPFAQRLYNPVAALMSSSMPYDSRRH